MKTILILTTAILLSLPAIADPLAFIRPGGCYEIKTSGVFSTIIVRKISGEWVRAEILPTKRTIWINMQLVETAEEVARHEPKR